MTKIIFSPCGLYYKELCYFAGSWIQNWMRYVHSFVALSGPPDGYWVTGVGWMSCLFQFCRRIAPRHAFERRTGVPQSLGPLMSLLWKLSRCLVNIFQADHLISFCLFPAHQQTGGNELTAPLQQQWQSPWQISSIVFSQTSQSTLVEHTIVYKSWQLSDPSEIGTGERHAEQTQISASTLALISCVTLYSSPFVRTSAISLIYRA